MKCGLRCASIGALLILMVMALPARAADPAPPGVDPNAVVQTTEVSGWFQPLPFHRIIDLELTFPGFPDVLGLCVQGEPAWFISIEGCAGTFVLINSLSLDVRSRFIHYVHIHEARRADGRVDFRGWEFGLGPSIGVRDELLVVFLIVPLAATVTAVDAELSAEAVYWFSKRVGLKLQLDAGAAIAPATSAHASLTLPVAEFKIGVAF